MSKNETKRVCFYHSADFDGWCSGAVVASHFGWNETKLIPINYGQEFPWDEVDDETEVWMVDFCLQPFEGMVKLNESVKEFIWVDHHIASIREYNECLDAGCCGEIEGYRSEEKAACELVWEYLNPNKLSKASGKPIAVYLLSKYDIWKWKDVSHALEFQMGMRAVKHLNPADAHKDARVCENWDLLLHSGDTNIRDTDDYVREIIRDGATIIRYREIDLGKKAKGACFPAFLYRWPNGSDDVEPFPVIAANVGMENSQFFDAVLDDYPDAKALCSFHYRNNCWNFSLYKIPGRDTPDLSVIAKNYGGGGHAGAAGFQVLKVEDVIHYLGGPCGVLSYDEK